MVIMILQNMKLGDLQNLPNGTIRGVVRLNDIIMLKTTRFHAYLMPYLNSKLAACRIQTNPTKRMPGDA